MLKSLEAVRHSIDKADDQDREELSNLLKLLEKNSKGVILSSLIKADNVGNKNYF